ncbi:MAG: ROK family transcriptional regulator [Sphingomonas fennica]
MLTDAHATVLRLINQSGPLSRTELVGHLGVSKASMSALAADLMERGMLTEAEAVYGGGRPSIRLALQPSSAFFVGASLAGERFQLCVADLGGDVTAASSVPAGDDPRSVAEAIGREVGRLIEADGVDRSRVAGIGLSVPGLVDSAAGVCVRSTLLGWRDVPIGTMVGAATGLATFVENDANALVLGQHLFGALRGSRACTMIAVADGIGCGHIINGELHRGHRGGAGEIAHATIAPGGLPCKCGKRGCLDTLASTPAVANAAREAGLPGDFTALDAAAARGDQAAITILHHAGAALGLAIAQQIQSLDPEHILVALADGPLDGLYARVLRQTVEANVMPGGGQTQLSIIALDADAWAVGAAGVAAGRAFFRR